MCKLILSFFILIFSTTAFAQKVKNVCGEYTFYAPENVSLSEAKRIALERAKLQALADEFGTVISQVNTSVVKDGNGKADSHFFSLSGTEVKGEWIEDKGEPKYTYDTDKENGTLVVTCSICGKAREIISAQIEFMAKVLRNGIEAQNESEIFRSGDDMFLSFQSPTDGFIAVYLIDETPTAYCLLPYRKDGDGQQPVKHGEKYIFFSPKYDVNHPDIVDEYTLTCNKEEEHNQIYVIFSPKPFTKALDNQVKETIPRELDYEAFTKWLGNCRKRDKQMGVVIKNINIKGE